jgi:transcriptional regulator with XRE-family HTH domain
MQNMSPTISPTTNFLRDAIENSPKTQREIAQAAGFAHPNALSMMKTGETKVPISRIPALAAALKVDTKRFLQIAMREYHPEIWMTLEEFTLPSLSPIEEGILETYHIADR